MLRRRTLLLPALLGVFVLSVYLFTFPNDMQGNGDTWLRFETAQSIVDNHTFYYSESGTPTWTDKRVVQGTDHKLYSIYDPGQIFALIPGYIIGKVVAHHVTQDYVWTPRYIAFTIDDFFGALLAIVFFLIGLCLGYSRRVAATLTLIFAFATVAWPDAESYLEHTQVSFFLALSVLMSIIFVQNGMRQRWWVAGASLSVGCAFLTRYDSGVLLPLIPLYLGASRIAIRKPLVHSVNSDKAHGATGSGPRKAWAWLRDGQTLRSILVDWIVYVAALVPIFLAAAAWNFARFGSPIKTGIPPTFGEPILQGLSGLVLSPGKGIIWYMPLLFILPFVVRRFYRQHRLITIFFASIVVVEFLLFSNVIYWHGDPAWGPRYIYPTVPYLVLPLGVVLERWDAINQWAKRTFIAVLVLSFAVQFAAIVAPPYRYWYQEIHAQLVARQGFNWGYKDGHFWYSYYWSVPRNPILASFANLYEITALRVFGDNSYNYQASPIPPYEHLHLSNPVHSYEINNYNLWWLSKMHPFLGTHKDLLLAALLLLFGAGTFVLLRREMTDDTSEARYVVVELKRRPA